MKSGINLKSENKLNQEYSNSSKLILKLSLWGLKMTELKRKITLCLHLIELKSSIKIGDSFWEESWPYIRVKRLLWKARIRPNKILSKSAKKVSETQPLSNLFRSRLMKTTQTPTMTKMKMMTTLNQEELSETKIMTNHYTTFQLCHSKHFTSFTKHAKWVWCMVVVISRWQESRFAFITVYTQNPRLRRAFWTERQQSCLENLSIHLLYCSNQWWSSHCRVRRLWSTLPWKMFWAREVLWMSRSKPALQVRFRPLRSEVGSKS